MPVGQVQRIDEERGTAYVVQNGKTYAAPLSEVETKARVPSARVRFELVREKGVESAADVRLRVGTRSNRRHRRFGDLTGATQPGSKVQTATSRNFGIDVTTQPLRVARAWLDALSAQDYVGATSLYLPEATVHVGADSHVGHRRIRAMLEKTAIIDIESDSVLIDGIDRYVRICCRAGTGEHVIYLVAEKGAIAEQWIDVEPEQSIDEAEDERPILIVRHGEVPARAAEHATDRIEHLVEHSGRPLRSGKVKLAMAENPSVDSPALAEASLQFDHLMVRARASADSFVEAIDLMATRLAARIEHEHDRQRRQPTRLDPPSGTWRHGNLARPQTPFFDRPVEEREIVRHKSFAPEEMTPDEAALDMALLDYDFFLFVDVDTGRDAVLLRADDGSLVLHHAGVSAPKLHSTVNVIEVATAITPTLEVSEAIKLLNAQDSRLQFFVNRQTSRGNVIYRRLDGHYGLICL